MCVCVCVCWTPVFTLAAPRALSRPSFASDFGSASAAAAAAASGPSPGPPLVVWLRLRLRRGVCFILNAFYVQFVSI